MLFCPKEAKFDRTVCHKYGGPRLELFHWERREFHWEGGNMTANTPVSNNLP